VFSADRPIFSVRRKQERSKDVLSERAKARFIVGCEPTQSVPVQCIEVDSTSRLYLATRSMIPTHNSMLTTQAALELCVQRQRVLIASLEMAPARTMARMSRQAAAVSRPGVPAIEYFHGWTDRRLWLFDHVGVIDGEQCLALCRYFADKHAGQHVFIDSMMMVCGSEERLDEQKQFVTRLCRTAVETGLHLHLIAHCRKPSGGDDGDPPTKYDVKGSGAISDQASNVVMVWSDRAKAVCAAAGNAVDEAKPDALMTVEKQRNGAWEGRVKLWFHADSLRFTHDRIAPNPYELSEL
jgi:twinkle protein